MSGTPSSSDVDSQLGSDKIDTKAKSDINNKGLVPLEIKNTEIKNLQNQRIAIVASRFNAPIIEQLLQGALAELTQLGIVRNNIDISFVPGVFELPLVVKQYAKSAKHAGIIAFGAVIQGDTDHHVYISNECTRGLMKVMLKFDLPVAFGVLTTKNHAQAWQRACVKEQNKGGEVARSLIETIIAINKI